MPIIIDQPIVWVRTYLSAVSSASYTDNFDNDIFEASIVEQEERLALINNVGGNDISIFSTQLDYEKVLNERYSIEGGAKFGYVYINSSTTFFDIGKSNIPTRNDALSSSFEYHERVPAAYLNLKGKMRRSINYSIGVKRLSSPIIHYSPASTAVAQ